MDVSTDKSKRWQFSIRHLLLCTSVICLSLGFLRFIAAMKSMSAERRAVLAALLMAPFYCGLCGILYSRLCGASGATAFWIGTLLAIAVGIIVAMLSPT